MAGREASLELTDRYRTGLAGLRDRLLVVLGRSWGLIDRDELDESFAVWLAGAAGRLGEGQRLGVGVSGAYLAAFVTSELGRAATTPKVDADRFAGRARDGRALEDALFPAVIAVKVRLRDGATPPEALQAGWSRAARVVSMESMGAARDALDAGVSEDPRIAGWRRVVSSGACGACLASATGAIQDTQRVLEVHGHCRCVKEPVVSGVRDRARRPTGQERFDQLAPAQQARLFAGRGGEEKAKLVRDGIVPFSALIAPAPMNTVGDEITERPLKDLAALAPSA